MSEVTKRAAIKCAHAGTSLVVQWLRPHSSSAEDVGSIPGPGTKIPHAAQYGQKQTNKQTRVHMQTVELLPKQKEPATYHCIVGLWSVVPAPLIFPENS